MAETRPLASIKASRRTSPATCWVLASAGYAGGTEEIMRAGLTSPPTGTGAAGAAGCFALPSNRPPLKGDSLAGSCSSPASSVGSASPLRGVRALRLTLGFAKRTLPRLGLLISGSASSEDGLGVLAASTVAAGVETRSEMAAGWSLAAEPDEETERTLEPEAVVVAFVSGAEFSAVPALALDDGAEIDAALLGAVAAVSAAADVLTGKEFAAIALGSGLEDWRRYQVTPVAASTIPAAIAVIQIPLLPLDVLARLSAVVRSSVRPKTGAT